MITISKAEAMEMRKQTQATIVRMGHGEHYVMSEEPDALQKLAIMRGYKNTRVNGLVVPARELMMKDID